MAGVLYLLVESFSQLCNALHTTDPDNIKQYRHPTI
jgi:hypothetical protein